AEDVVEAVSWLPQRRARELLADRRHEGIAQRRSQQAGAHQVTMPGQPADAQRRQRVPLADAAGGQRAPASPADSPETDVVALVMEAAERFVAVDQHVVTLGPPGDLLEVLGSDEATARVARLHQHQQPRPAQGPVQLVETEAQAAI